LAENTHDGSDLDGHAALLHKADYTQVSPHANIGSQGWNTGSGTPVAGPGSGTAGISRAGTLWYRRGGHTQALGAYVSTDPYDLTSLTTQTNPSGGNTRADYRRAWREPSTGTLFVYFRGNDG